VCVRLKGSGFINGVGQVLGQVVERRDEVGEVGGGVGLGELGVVAYRLVGGAEGALVVSGLGQAVREVVEGDGDVGDENGGGGFDNCVEEEYDFVVGLGRE
jgi:hypothetical protein